uniref:restriction endonuclease subunit S n=1 Tax=uncultured Halomonas sp. TaxID=173971 RepID=UPI00262B221C|nr:restriction endonuclease subunit S [uncultured Halomonas sp.]
MSFPKYPEYKDSGVEWLGEVPAHWDVRRLKFVLSQITDRATERVNPVALENIEGWSGRYVEGESDYSGGGIAFQKGDILFGKLRPYLAKVYLPINHGEAVGDFHVMRPCRKLSERYAFHQLLQPQFISVVDGATHGAKMPRVGWEVMGNMPFVTPPLHEQAHIATFLDYETARIDALVEEQQRLIELLKEKRQAVISHAVTKGLDPDVPMKDSGVEWLGEVPAHWEVGGLTKFIGPIVDYRGRTPEKVDDGVFLVTAKNIRDGRIDYEVSREYADPDSAKSLLERGKPEIGDLLFTMEAPLGQVALIDRTDIALAQRIVKFKGVEGVMMNSYLMYWLMSTGCQARMETLATGSTALGIKASKLGMIECPAPPVTEQEEIVSHIERESAKHDVLLAEAQANIDLLQKRRSALISAAVTGKIDVRGWQPPEVSLAHVEAVQMEGV